VAVLDEVVLGLGPGGVARHAAALAEPAEPVEAPGDELVHVGLVAGVPDDDVAGRVEHAVERQRELDRPQVGTEVAAVDRDRVDQDLTDLRRERSQLVIVEPAQRLGSVDRFEQGSRQFRSVGRQRLIVPPSPASVPSREPVSCLGPGRACASAKIDVWLHAFMADTAPPQHVADISAFITYVSRLATSEAVRRRAASAAERLVTPAESAALRAIADAGPFTYKGLAEHLDLDQTTISRTAGRLQELGLVERETDADDRRKAWLSITQNGHSMLDQLQTVAVQWYEVAISEWTPDQQRALGDMLRQFQHDLQRLEFDGTGRATGLTTPAPSEPQEVCA
jgi:DNA-binding MarR family transcriptional regulator